MVTCTVGVPLMTPPELNDNPAGKVMPTARDHVKVPVVPTAASVAENWLFCTATNTGGVMVGMMVRPKVAVAEFELESVTWKLTCALFAAAVGVPVICPPEVNVNPAGRLVGNGRVHVNGVGPPVAVRVWEYATPTVPPGSGEGVETARFPMLTVAVASTILGKRLAWMVAVPLFPVLVYWRLVLDAVAGKVTVAGTVTTPGLSELTFKVRPPAGAGPESDRNIWPFVLGTVDVCL